VIAFDKQGARLDLPIEPSEFEVNATQRSVELCLAAEKR
jgi:hypothetical protein